MVNPFRLTPRRGLALIGLAGLLLVGVSVVLAATFDLAACPLCILQRMLYLLLALEAALLFVLDPRWVAGAMGVTAATGAGVAAYHVWLQRFASGLVTCGGQQAWWERWIDWAGQQLPWLFGASGQCAEASWTLLGLSIAEWSLLCFSALTLLASWFFFMKPAASHAS